MSDEVCGVPNPLHGMNAPRAVATTATAVVLFSISTTFSGRAFWTIFSGHFYGYLVAVYTRAVKRFDHFTSLIIVYFKKGEAFHRVDPADIDPAFGVAVDQVDQFGSGRSYRLFPY